MEENMDTNSSQHVDFTKTKRNSVPPTANAIINQEELKKQIAIGSVQMDNCIEKGINPIFGYPLVLYSPIGESRNQYKQNWQLVYRSTMNTYNGKFNVIGELLDNYDEFRLK